MALLWHTQLSKATGALSLDFNLPLVSWKAEAMVSTINAFSGSQNAVFSPLFFTAETSQAIQNLVDFLTPPFCGNSTTVLRE